MEINPAVSYSPTEWPLQYHRPRRTLLPCSGWERVWPLRYDRRKIFEARLRFVELGRCESTTTLRAASFRSLRSPACAEKKKVVKPHDRLVPVSSTHCCASTPGLSTTSSTWGLQETEVSGIPDLEGGFPLRCFQRLSLPSIATRRCHWRDNRNTRGSSIPVLSY